MGYYIQTRQSHNKAQYIVKELGGEMIEKPKSFSDIPADKALIVVVNNGAFEAAGLAYNKAEFDEFTRTDDPRPRKYVLMDKVKAHDLTDYKEAEVGK